MIEEYNYNIWFFNLIVGMLRLQIHWSEEAGEPTDLFITVVLLVLPTISVKFEERSTVDIRS